jgi:hypothetical protein
MERIMIPWRFEFYYDTLELRVRILDALRYDYHDAECQATIERRNGIMNLMNNISLHALILS